MLIETIETIDARISSFSFIGLDSFEALQTEQVTTSGLNLVVNYTQTNGTHKFLYMVFARRKKAILHFPIAPNRLHVDSL